MKEYRIIVPIGGALPQTEKLIQVLLKGESDEKPTPEVVMVSSIRSITWGTKDGNDKVAGVFVDFWGTPWPPILLPPDVKKRRKKHIAVYAHDTGLLRCCLDSDDVMEEVLPGSCPNCAKQEQLKEALTPEGKAAMAQIDQAEAELLKGRRAKQ